jgi:hypothetical protein
MISISSLKLKMHKEITRFSPIQGLWTDPFCLSVRWHDKSFQTQHIDLKLSTHLFEAFAVHNYYCRKVQIGIYYSTTNSTYVNFMTDKRKKTGLQIHTWFVMFRY